MRLLFVLLGGVIFGAGLALSEMARPEVVLSFLQLQDMGLALVMAAAVVVTALGYAIGRRMDAPVFGKAFSKGKPVLDDKTVYGSVIFGAGWGISGICPGAAFASLGIGNWPIVVAIAAMLLGAWVHGRFIES